MKAASIKLKLALLAGVPVLGAVLLGLVLAYNATRALQKARSLGSVEAVAELSANMSALVHELQTERARLARHLGRIAPAPELDTLADEAGGPAAPPRGDPTASLATLEQQFDATDEALANLARFLASRDMTRLPERLAEELEGTQAHLARIREIRELRRRSDADLEEPLAYYRLATMGLIRATAGLNELSDDGDLLRGVNSLVTILEWTERASEEHALLAHVLERREFPPGSYRTLVTLQKEQETLASVFRTNAPTDHQRLLAGAVSVELDEQTRSISARALDATADRVQGDPLLWFDRQGQRVDQLAGVANQFNNQVRATAVAKRDATRQTVWLGTALASGVLLVSTILAWLIARGISLGISELRNTTELVGSGDLTARVRVATHDELGQLGRAFNQMISEVATARAASEERARMGRELEIAASIQRQLLPPTPTHPDLEFSGKMVPADEVGGDFYDVLTGERDTLWVTVGDVSSHGLSAGLVMVMAQAAFATHYYRDPDAPPDTVLRGVNRVLQTNINDRLGENKYLTAQLLTYRGAGTFRCVGAHEWPIVYRCATGDTEVVETPGPWLGILPTLDEVPLLDLHLDPGDVLCLYSDGLTEARNEGGELLDLTRFRRLLEKALTGEPPLERAVVEVFEAVSSYASQQEDDWSLLLVRRRPANVTA